MKKIILMLLFVFAVFVTNAFGQTSSAGFQMDGTTLTKYTGNATNVTIPNSVKSIGDYAFMRNTNITNVTIPNGVTHIGNHAFYYSTSLTNVEIPLSVTSIEAGAFEDTWIPEITIPASVKSIGNYAFIRSGVAKITFEGITDLHYDAIQGNLFSIYRADGIGTYVKTGDVWAKQAQTPATPRREPIQTPDNQDPGRRAPRGR
jgi:hypothetical protein